MSHRDKMLNGRRRKKNTMPRDKREGERKQGDAEKEWQADKQPVTEKLLREMGREAETHRGRKTDSKESKQRDVEIKIQARCLQKPGPNSATRCFSPSEGGLNPSLPSTKAVLGQHWLC